MIIVKPEQTNDATLNATNVSESDYTLFDLATTYSLNQMAMYIAPNIHWVIRSKIDSNTGNIPTGLPSDANWVKVSETNRWKMFDLKTTSQTFNNDSIDVTIIGTGMNNALYAGNLDGTDLTVTVRDVDDNIVYTKTESLIDVSGIYDPYTFYFSEVVKKQDILLLDLPPYALASYQVVISNPGAVAKCGFLLIGFQTNAGNTNYGLSIGITDYSVKRADEFGDFIITERAYSKNMILTTRIQKAQQTALVNLLNAIRAVPTIWIGSELYESSYAYGFYKDYNVVVDYPNESLINIEIEGLS